MSTALAPTRTGAKDVRDLVSSPKALEGFRAVATKYLTPERLVKLVIAACHKTPKLLECTPESVLQCAMQCCQYGVEPDGRHAHLIPYGKVCTFQLDWKGIVAIGRRNDVTGIVADTICENDEFVYFRDENGTHFKHVPKFGDRGDIVGVYSQCTIDGQFDVEVMTKAEVEDVRQKFSTAKDAAAWSKSWPEMAKKTVIKRHSKRWPLSAEESEALHDGERITSAKVVEISKPIFPTLTATQQPAAEEPEGQAAPVERSVMNDEPEPPTSPNYVKGIQGLLKAAKLEEKDLLAYLFNSGDAYDHLRDVPSDTLKDLYDRWQYHEKEIRTLKEMA